MAVYDFGALRLNVRGDYSTSGTYSFNDVVRYRSGLYAYTDSTPTTGVLPSDTTRWTLMFSTADFAPVSLLLMGV